METSFLQILSSKSPTTPKFRPVSTPQSIPTTALSHLRLPHRRQSFILGSIDGSNETPQQPSPPPPTITPPDTVEIRFKRGSRRRMRQQGEDSRQQPVKAQVSNDSPPKKWEDMNLSEKAVELYMGEKGMLFWLNKFAYASIFIVIGGWILFRFAGPALNLYQLDAPPLPPSSMFKG